MSLDDMFYCTGIQSNRISLCVFKICQFEYLIRHSAIHTANIDFFTRPCVSILYFVNKSKDFFINRVNILLNYRLHVVWILRYILIKRYSGFLSKDRIFVAQHGRRIFSLFCSQVSPAGSVPRFDLTSRIPVKLGCASAFIFRSLFLLVQKIHEIPHPHIAVGLLQLIAPCIKSLPFRRIFCNLFQCVPINLATGHIRQHGIQFHHITVEFWFFLLNPADLLLSLPCLADIRSSAGIEASLNLPIPASDRRAACKSLAVLNRVLNFMKHSITDSFRHIFQLITDIDIVKLSIILCIHSGRQALEHHADIPQIWICFKDFSILQQFSQCHIVRHIFRNSTAAIIYFEPPLSVHALEPTGLLPDSFIGHACFIQFFRFRKRLGICRFGIGTRKGVFALLGLFSIRLLSGLFLRHLLSKINIAVEFLIGDLSGAEHILCPGTYLHRVIPIGGFIILHSISIFLHRSLFLNAANRCLHRNGCCLRRCLLGAVLGLLQRLGIKVLHLRQICPFSCILISNRTEQIIDPSLDLLDQCPVLTCRFHDLLLIGQQILRHILRHNFLIDFLLTAERMAISGIQVCLLLSQLLQISAHRLDSFQHQARKFLVLLCELHAVGQLMADNLRHWISAFRIDVDHSVLEVTVLDTRFGPEVVVQLDIPARRFGQPVTKIPGFPFKVHRRISKLHACIGVDGFLLRRFLSSPVFYVRGTGADACRDTAGECGYDSCLSSFEQNFPVCLIPGIPIAGATGHCFGGLLPIA